MLSFRLKKQTSENVADTTFKEGSQTNKYPNTITSTFHDDSESNLVQRLQYFEEGTLSHLRRIHLKKGVL